MSSLPRGFFSPPAGRQRALAIGGSLLGMFAWYWVVAHWFPLKPGRDMLNYYVYFRDMFQIEPTLPMLMVFRTPVTPVFYGVLFQSLDWQGVQVVLSLLYAGSVTAVFVVMLEYGLVAAWATNLLIAVNMWCFSWYNAVGSETVQMILACAWFCGTFYALRSARLSVWIGLALLVVLMVLNRPANQTFLLTAFLPLVFSPAGWRRRLLLTACFLAVYFAGHFVYCSLNHLRYGQFCIARLGNAHMPFYRLFVQERAISPDNGPASQALAEFVRARVLSDPVFQEYEVTEETFFRYSSQRMFNGLVAALTSAKLTKPDFSAGRDFPIMREAGMESLRKDPWGSVLRFADHVMTVMSYDYRKPFNWKFSDLNERGRAWRAEHKRRYARYAELNLQGLDGFDFLPPTDIYVQNTGRGKDTWFEIQHTAKSWRLYRQSAAEYETSDQLRRASNRIIPGFSWFFLSAVCVLLAVLLGERDFRVVVLCGVVFANLLASLFSSIQWEFRCPFDPIFSAFAIVGFWLLLRRFYRHRLLIGNALQWFGSPWKSGVNFKMKSRLVRR